MAPSAWRPGKRPPPTGRSRAPAARSLSADAVCGWRSRRRCSCRPPYLVHPARLTVHLIQLLALFGGAIAGIGPLGALGVGWAIAAVTSLVIGTPAAAPTTRSVLAALDELGVSVGELALGNNQTWGERAASSVTRAPASRSPDRPARTPRPHAPDGGEGGRAGQRGRDRRLRRTGRHHAAGARGTPTVTPCRSWPPTRSPTTCSGPRGRACDIGSCITGSPWRPGGAPRA